MAEMAALVGEKELAAEAGGFAGKARAAAAEKFWKVERRSHVHALTRSGKQNPERTVWPAVGILLGVFDGERADATAEMLASGALGRPGDADFSRCSRICVLASARSPYLEEERARTSALVDTRSLAVILDRARPGHTDE